LVYILNQIHQLELTHLSLAKRTGGSITVGLQSRPLNYRDKNDCLYLINYKKKYMQKIKESKSEKYFNNMYSYYFLR
jgi:hypothetical protein